MEQVVNEIEEKMRKILTNKQMRKLDKLLKSKLINNNLLVNNGKIDYCDIFIRAKYVEGCSKKSMDNIRRILSSFFSWIENEQYITQNPIRRIHKIKTETIIKETFTDENLIIMKENVLY